MLKGKTALITGSNSGIGLGVAQEMARAGADVIINSFSDSAADHAIAADIAAEFGVSARYIAADMSDEAACRALIKKAGQVDILVNNAGIHNKKPSIEVTDAEFQMVMDTNINSVFALTRTVLKYMMPREKGSVISISSMAALFGITQVVAYSSAKTALLGMTRSLASEYSHTGVRFNTIAPGFIETKMFLDIMEKDPKRK